MKRKKAAKTKQKPDKQPPTRFEMLLRDASSDATGLAATMLLRLADQLGMRSEDVSRDPALWPKRFKQPTPAVVARANRLEHDYSNDLQEGVKQWNALHCPDPVLPEEFQPQEQQAVTKTRNQRTLFGFQIKHVVRWMGKEGWALEDVRQVMLACGVELWQGEASLRGYLREGRNGEEHAALTTAHTNYLYDKLE